MDSQNANTPHSKLINNKININKKNINNNNLKTMSLTQSKARPMQRRTDDRTLPSHWNTFISELVVVANRHIKLQNTLDKNVINKYTKYQLQQFLSEVHMIDLDSNNKADYVEAIVKHNIESDY